MLRRISSDLQQRYSAQLGGRRAESLLGASTHHIRNAILDLEDVFALRADHLTVLNHNLLGAKFGDQLSFVSSRAPRLGTSRRIEQR